MLTKLPGIVFWHHSVQGFFFKKSKSISTSYVVFHALSKFMKFVSVLLPLKVVLLLSTPGVPAYFSSLISVESKPYWVMGLVCATIIMYLSSFIFDGLKGSLARRMAGLIVRDESTAVESVVEAEKIYSRIARAYGDLFYFFIVFSVGLLVNATLFAGIMCCVLFEIGLFGLWVRYSKAAAYKKREIISAFWRKWGGAFPSVNFLLGFIFLLLQFAYLEFDNAFYAIVSIVALRQNMSVMKSYGDHGVWLWENKEKVYGVIDSKRNTGGETGRETVVSKKVLGTYQRILHFAPDTSRHERFLNLVGPALFIEPDSTRITSQWLDPSRSNSIEFTYDMNISGSNSTRRFHERLDFSTDRVAIENERKLIQYSQQLALPCPDHILFHALDEGVVQKIQEIGRGEFATDMGAREQALKALLFRLWSVDLSGMTSLYNNNNAYALVDLELSPWDWKILHLIAQGAEEQGLLKTFKERVQGIKEAVLDVPLALAHFHLPGSNIYLREDGDPVIIDWKGWKAAPIGVRLNMLMTPEKFLADLPADFFQRKTHTGQHLTPEHLMLVSCVEKMQQDLKASRYRLVIGRIPDLLHSYDRLCISMQVNASG